MAIINLLAFSHSGGKVHTALSEVSFQYFKNYHTYDNTYLVTKLPSRNRMEWEVVSLGLSTR